MIIDIIIIAVILLCVIMAYRKGLVEVAFRLISFILAIVLSFTLYIPVANAIIENTEIDEKIKETIENTIKQEDFVPEQEDSATIDIGEAVEPTETKKEQMPDIITNYISKTITEAADTAKDNLAEVVATNLAITAIKIVTLIVLFIIIKIVLSILKIIINAIASLPVINSANKIGGIIYGVLEALLIIYVALAIAMAISTITGNTDILAYINESTIGKIMFNNNVLLKIIFP